MTRRCKDCIMAENKKLKEKLEKIKDIVVANYTCKCALEDIINIFEEGAEE